MSMLTVGLVAVLNIGITIYLARKKWFLASIAYALSFLVLLAVAGLRVEHHFVVDGLIGIFGRDLYHTLHEQALVYSEYALAPHLGMIVLAGVIAIVVTMQAAERIIKRVLSKSSLRYRKSTRTEVEHIHLPAPIITRKQYLSFCVLLC